MPCTEEVRQPACRMQLKVEKGAWWFWALSPDYVRLRLLLGNRRTDFTPCLFYNALDNCPGLRMLGVLGTTPAFQRWVPDPSTPWFRAQLPFG